MIIYPNFIQSKSHDFLFNLEFGLACDAYLLVPLKSAGQQLLVHPQPWMILDG